MKRTTKEWVRKAENDYRTAELLALSSEPLHDQLCFHCQQAAEKYLKALLEELDHERREVQIQAIGVKKGNRLFVAGEEVEL